MQLIALGDPGINGQHVVQHVVREFKYEPEKYKLMNKMAVFHAMALQPSKRIVIPKFALQVTHISTFLNFDTQIKFIRLKNTC